MKRLPNLVVFFVGLLLVACTSPQTPSGSTGGDQSSQTPGSGMTVAYPGFPSVLYVGEPFGPYLPTVTGGTALDYDTTSLLPTGITVDKPTGGIAGTPTVATPAADYLFWAFASGGNSAGNASTTLRFSVASQFKALTAIPASAHQYGAAVLLADGRVLIAGGYLPAPPKLAEIYDPATGLFTTTKDTMTVGRIHLTATLIDRGPWKNQVLLVGDSTSTELYDPVSDTFSPGPNLGQILGTHTATRLGDGRILFVGGTASVGADLWNPTDNTFAAVHPPLVVPRVFHCAALLQDGRVLIAGGYDGTGVTATAEIFDPGTDTFTATGSLNDYREYSVAVTLPGSGKVLFVGGAKRSGTQYVSTAELFDPAANAGVGAFTTTGTPTVARRLGHTATLLSDGKVLVAGGLDGTSSPLRATETTEIYDPAAGTFHRIGSLSAKRENHFAVAIAGGSVLVGGGDNGDTGSTYYQKTVDKYK